MADWSSKVPPDIAYFIPYEWEFKFHFRDYELICLVNEHNWIDCTSDSENGMPSLVRFSSRYKLIKCFFDENVMRN